MFNKVLVTLDGSKLAEAVLPYVEEIAQSCAAEVILLQVVAPPPTRVAAIYQSPRDGMPMQPLPELAEDLAIAQHPIYREQEMASLRAETEQSLAGAKGRLSKAGLNVRVEVLFGQPAERIVEYAMKEEVDLIACPVAPTTAFRIGEHGDDPLSMYLEDVFTLPANLAGVPGIAFPVGFDSNHLPIGMQLNAPHLGEEALFRAAHAYQGITSWHKEHPLL